MPSSKGKPTDPKKREEAKKEVLNMEKGGGKGQWSAWKAAEMSKKYEAKGGKYEDTGDNPNQAKTGAPSPKKKAIESGERKDPSEAVGTPKKRKTEAKDESAKEEKPKKPRTKKEPKPAAKGTREQPKRGVKK
ncbi:DNA binding protein URE-B1 [Pseudozyma hubeiensis SY62]|uniref:DNA binding protein URE-B1 n=1 Tax=Pseudozyma hubeiensis (strain SY62) TaxID=1305764 RepID=R9P812_PSEHS|nr:DNA binding protein URE-B1 [Pseudozyma hubeiensis SY62]GAC97474.1 DNA binding protein URE-B1 [Pseudozyma hubeiensis SY62]